MPKDPLTRVSQILAGLSNHRFVAPAIICGIVVIALASFTDAFATIWSVARAAVRLATPRPTPQETDIRNLLGRWVVMEKSDATLGNYWIVWHYDFSIDAAKIRGVGKKVRVNTLAANDTERKAVSAFTLDLHGLEARGTFLEINYLGEALHGKIFLHFSEDLLSFTGGTFQGPERTTTLSGHKQPATP